MVKGKLGLIAFKEAFQTETAEEEIKIPKELGIKHPYDFRLTEEMFKRHPLVQAAVEKHADSIVANFLVECKDANVKKLIEGFIKDINFKVILYDWVISALVTGNGYLEIDLQKNDLKLLDPKTIYVRRDKKGNILGYNQYLGNLKLFRQNKIIPLKTNQVAHLKLNGINNEAYGYGLIWANMNELDKLIQEENDMGIVSSRKATAPYHVKIGQPGEAVDIDDINDFNQKLEYLNNRTEWVTDANVEISAIDFGNIPDKFAGSLDHYLRMLYFGFQVPPVLLGLANVPEGLAKAQSEAFQRRIKSMQERIEKVIEEKIFKQILYANGFQEDVEIVWELPGEDEINTRLDKLTALLNNYNLSINMRRILELELAEVLQVEKPERFLNKPDIELKKLDDERSKIDPLELEPKNEENPERKEEEKIKQPEVPGVKRESHKHIQILESDDMTIREWVNLQEIRGFNYTDYLINILRVLKVDRFDKLRAITEQDLSLGLLEEQEIDKLREVLKQGFQKNKTIKQIEKDIRDNVNIPDRYTLTDNEMKLVLSAEQRPNMISRTETVRLANEGLIKTYADNEVKEVSFLAALSDRTCAECEALNGRIYTINESRGVIPIHSNCRCTFTPVVK